MARKRNKRKNQKRNNEVRPFRTIFSLLAILTLAFTGLAQFASPVPDGDINANGVLDASDLTQNLPASHVGHALPNMDRMKIDNALFGGSELRTQSARMRASLATNPRFSLGSLHIGMTYGEFQKLSAGRGTVRATTHGVLGVMRNEQHRFNAYFTSDKDDAPAQRLSYHRTFRDRTEREITEYLGDLWGKPASTACRRLVYDAGQDCQYAWWPVNGVKLTAQVRRTEDSTARNGKITLRIDAINDQAGKRRASPRMNAVRLAANLGR